MNEKPSPPDTSRFYRMSDKNEDDNDSSETGCFSSLKTALLSLLCRRAPKEEPCGVRPYPCSNIAPSLFPEWTPAELETLIARWTCTHPGPLTHPQNVEISSLISLLDSSSASQSDISILHASLLHRLKMDHNIELLAREIGLSWIPSPTYPDDSQTFSPGVLGIEDFEPPPGKALTTEARRILLGCRGEWKEAVMPLPVVGVRMRYRKPKYWVVSVAAVCGCSSEELDARMEEWFAERGGDGLFE